MIVYPQERIEWFKSNGWWGKETIYTLFANNASKYWDSTALVDAPNKPDFVGLDSLRLSYGELVNVVDNIASQFLKAGIEKDDVVMIQLPNTAEMVCVYLACSRIGAIVSPIAVQYRQHELNKYIRIAEPKAYIGAKDFNGFNFLNMIDEIRPDHQCLKLIIGLGNDLPEAVLSLSEMLTDNTAVDDLHDYLLHNKVTSDDVFSICWTSGTEADPKAVTRSTNEWLGIGSACYQLCEVKEGYNILNPFPLINMSSIGGMWVPWLLSGGGAFVVHHPFDLKIMLGQLQDEKINYTLIPPAVLNSLLQNPAILESYDISSLISVGSGSAPLSPWMVKKFQIEYGISVYNVFGSTEGILFVSNFDNPEERALYFPRSGNTLNYGMPNYLWQKPINLQQQTKLVDPITKEEITERGIAGEMCIKGPNVFCGYYKRPDLTAKAFDSEGFFNTGDMFTIEGEDGNWNKYMFTGRSKDLIIRGGWNISPEEVENAVLEHPKVIEVAAVGYPDDRLGEKVCIAVVTKPEDTITLEEINHFLDEKNMAIFKRPEKIIILDALPRNPVGKVVKSEIKSKL